MTAVSVVIPAGSDWTSEEVAIANVTGSTVFYGPQAPLTLAPDTVVYKHTVQIQLLSHAAHEWPAAMEMGCVGWRGCTKCGLRTNANYILQ